MRFAIPITSDTQEFIGKFLNNGVVPEVEERGSMFVIHDDGETPNDIVPADDDLFRLNNNRFYFVTIPVWGFVL